MLERPKSSLITHFESRPLKTLGITTLSLQFTISHQPIEMPKIGLAGLLAKLPFMSDEPVALDIDISCGLYDELGKLIEVVWYGNLRSQDKAVRHHGDTFIGMNKAYRPNVVEENLTIKLHELSKAVHSVAFFVHSKTQHALESLDGLMSLKDNENKLIHDRSFVSFDETVIGLCAWQLLRLDDDWQLFAPMTPLTGKHSGDLAYKWQTFAKHD